MKPDMPPPVTAKSSLNKLYEEIEALREEIEQQQTMLNEMRSRFHDAERKSAGLEYQIGIIRAVLSREPK